MLSYNRIMLDQNTEVFMSNQEKERELLEGFKRLPPESQNFILSTVITAVTAQEAVLRELSLRSGEPVYADRRPVPMGCANG